MTLLTSNPKNSPLMLLSRKAITTIANTSSNQTSLQHSQNSNKNSHNNCHYCNQFSKQKLSVSFRSIPSSRMRYLRWATPIPLKSNRSHLSSLFKTMICSVYHKQGVERRFLLYFQSSITFAKIIHLKKGLLQGSH